MMLVIIFMLTNNNIIYAINLNGKILNNVYVQDINLSDLTKEEAIKKINSYIEQNNEFELFYNDESILVNKETLGVDYKVDELVDRAYSIGRDKDLITDMKTKISLKKGEKKIIPLTCSYNIKKVDNLIDKIYSKLTDELDYGGKHDADIENLEKSINICREIYFHMQSIELLESKLYLNKDNYNALRELYNTEEISFDVEENKSPVFNYHLSKIIEEIKTLKEFNKSIE